MPGNSVVRDKTNERHGLFWGIESCDVTHYRKLFKNPCSQAELNKIVPFGFSLQRQKMVFFLPSK